MANEEYEVESILQAKVQKRGRNAGMRYLVKWKGYDSSDNTWEPRSSFEGSADEMLQRFWQRIDLGGRDISDMSQFINDEEFHPRGPPPRRSRRSIGEGTALPDPQDKAETVEERKASSSKLERASAKRPRASTDAEQVQRKRGRVSGTRRKSQVGRAVGSGVVSPAKSTPARKTRAASSNEVVPDSEDEGHLLATPGAAGAHSIHAANNEELFGPSDSATVEGMVVTKSVAERNHSPAFAVALQTTLTLPAHRIHTTNSLAKRTDDAELEHSLEGTISAKAKSLKKRSDEAVAGSSTRPRAGPGRSSIGLRTNSILTFDKNSKSLKTLKGTYRPTEEGTQDDESPVEHLASSSRGVNAATFDSAMLDEDIPEPDTSHINDGTSSLLAPSGQQLLELGGFKSADADVLPDFTEDISNQEKVTSTGPNGVTATEPAPPKSVFSSASWKTSTIFGPLSLGASFFRPPIQALPEEQPLSPVNEPYLLSLDPAVAIPVVLKDIQPSTSLDGASLDSVISHGAKGPPGKLYKDDEAVALLHTLQTGGSSARLALHERANEEQREFFVRFRLRLEQGGLFLVMAGDKVVACCSSTNQALGKKLGIPSALQGLAENVVVSHVKIRDYSAFADAAVQADVLHW